MYQQKIILILYRFDHNSIISNNSPVENNKILILNKIAEVI